MLSRRSYLPFIVGDSLFYTASDYKNKNDYQVIVPSNWSILKSEDWINYIFNYDELPDQGWKIHISCAYGQEKLVVKLVSQYSIEHNLSFKITKNKELWLLKNSKYADRSESGKFITLYPKDEATFTQVLQELDQRLKQIKSGPYILSDRQWQDSCLYYRYGAFKKITMKKSGKTVYCIYTPDGKKIEDRREPYYNQPSFVDEPAFVKNNNFKTAGYPGDELKKYNFKGALHFSNAGGVYLVERDNNNYVLKEGRPYAGIDGQKLDGFNRINREAKYLKKLNDINGIVNFKEQFFAWKHNYLVEEYVPGETLTEYIEENYPFYNSNKYFDFAIVIAKKLLSIVEQVHSRGVAIGDLQPSNIIVNVKENGVEVTICDLEQANSLASKYTPGLLTLGYGNLKVKNFEQADWYALHQIIRGMFLPSVMLNHYTNEVNETQNINIAKYVSNKVANFLTDIDKICYQHYQIKFNDQSVVHSKLFTEPNEVKKGLITGISHNIDLVNDSLIKPDVIAFIDSENSFNVRDGGWGLGLLIARSEIQRKELKSKFNFWLSKHRLEVEELTEHDKGLFTGAAGIGSIMYELGDKDLGKQLIYSSYVETKDISLESGLSGMGLARLALYKIEPETAERDKILFITKEVVANYHKCNELGLINGKLGAILFLWKVGIELNEPDCSKLALKYLDKFIQTRVKGDQYLFIEESDVDQSRLMPYLYSGTAGLILLIEEMLIDRPDLTEKYKSLLVRGLDTLNVNVTYMNGLFNGYIGLFLPKIAAKKVVNYQVDWKKQINLLSNYLITREGEILTPNMYADKCSLDLATGAIGDYLTILGLTKNDWGLWLPIIHSDKFRIFRG